jgi:hypothetical protein
LFQVMSWFWKSVALFNQEEIARLLQFTTGSSQLPPGGFSCLTPKFSFSSSPLKNVLPRAHTWYKICLCYSVLNSVDCCPLQECRNNIFMACSHKFETLHGGKSFLNALIYPGSRCSLRGERNERREGRASGHIGCKSHFHTLLGSEFESRM